MCRHMLAILFLAAFVNAGEAFAKSPPPGTGYQDVKTNVLIMLDTSGSMDTEVPNGALEYPYSLAFDSLGNFYVASKDNSTITKYTSAGEFVTSWGSYGTTSGKFRYIYAIAIDSSDNIYVADQNNGRVQKFTTDGTYVSQFDFGSSMRGIAVDSAAAGRNVYAINSSGNVRKYNSSGTIVSSFSTSSAGTNTGAYMIAVDASDNLYVTEYANKRIRKYTSAGAVVSGFSTSTLSYGPLGIVAGTDGKIYVSDYTNSKIYAYSATTRAASSPATYGSVGTTLGKWKNPAGLALRPSDSTVWVADYMNNRVQGLASTLLFTPPTAETRMDQAKTLIKAIVSNSNLTDGANFGLMKWNSTASMVTNVSETGAGTIYTAVDALSPGGGTYLDYGMNLAESYLFGADSPIINDAWCQNTILIVISDGFWTDTTATTDAGSLYNTYGIKTFAIGFQVDTSDTGINNYVTIATAGGTYPSSPVFADNWQSVYESLSQYILEIIATNLTFSAPTIMPSITNGDHILQSTFKHKTTHQWKGSLSKYALESDGSIGALQWEAGSLLAVKAASSRNIWTANTGLDVTDLNNFTVANIDDLRVPMLENMGTALTDTALENLISFVRGIDSYSEFSGGIDDDGDTIIAGERWKLADIYHSRTISVGAPNAVISDKAATNTEAYYRSQNGYADFKLSSLCGTACTSRTEVVYAGGNDGMLHAFDASTGAEKWAFIPPSVLPNFKDIISTNANQSIGIYGVDGSPVVKDIYYGGAWHTILLSGLRQGGKSYFALDVTNPDAPAHLFTFAQNTITGKVSYWAADGTRTDYTSATVPAAYNFFTLGESWSEPVILRLPVGASNAMKWVAVFGGGYNSGISTSYGAKLFIIDMENGGQIVQNIDIGDSISTNGIVSSVPPTVTAVTGDSTSLFTATGAIIYFSDLEGKLWKVNLTTSGTLYETTKLFNAESTSTNTRHSFHPTAAAITSDGILMQYYGSGNMQDLGAVNASIANRAFAIKDINFPNFTSIASMSTVTDLANVSGGVCPTDSQKGWYLGLNSNEKVTAKATVKNSVVLFPRYTANNTDICSAGTGSITEHSFSCGTTLRTTSLGNGVPTEAVLYKNKIYVGISTDQADSTLGTGFTKQGNLIVGTPVSPATGEVAVESWWEDF